MSVGLSPDEVLTTAQLAARLDRSIHTLNWWRRNGRGPKFTKITKTFGFYTLADVEEWERKTGRRPA